VINLDTKEAGPRRVKIDQMVKIEMKFSQIIFCMEDSAYMMVYEDGKFF
jgi:hypothetical protein